MSTRNPSLLHPRFRALIALVILAVVLIPALSLLDSTSSNASPAPPSDSGTWVPPLSGRFTVSGPYLAPPHPYASGHRGIDFPASPGFTARSPAAGTVTFAGTVVDRGVVSVQVDEHTVFSLEPITSSLRAGDTVRAGEVLGTVSSGGHCYDECIHLGVRVDGEYVNPLRYFYGRAVLVAWE
ncbi:M23 family metallopeptidase [Leucobacter insecticola]|uniref:M23 family metallopeptidase n=1 Tax=Leucobacter insecticola TaxID=2714934 RepID=A0A6G8FKG6_9MICO|nr:M23 family metallopeptidase [Leucobacter insecticola]QIM16779.1 M23 family metallopeptidase [Leucobacter insecticola]